LGTQKHLSGGAQITSRCRWVTNFVAPINASADTSGSLLKKCLTSRLTPVGLVRTPGV
jgi:hypothetical protein